MKAAKTIYIILATFCCLLVLPSALQAFFYPGKPTQTAVKLQYQYSSASLGENNAISQPLFEINLSVSVKKGFEVVDYSFLALCQSMGSLFIVKSEYLKYSFNYFIHHYIASLIFPFHYFW